MMVPAHHAGLFQGECARNLTLMVGGVVIHGTLDPSHVTCFMERMIALVHRLISGGFYLTVLARQVVLFR